MLPQVDALLRQLLAAPTTTHVRALQDALQQYSYGVEARQYDPRSQVLAPAKIARPVETVPMACLWLRGSTYVDEAARAERAVPHQAFRQHGIPFGMGTDNKPYNPFHTLWAAVERRERRTGAVLGPQQCLTRAQALHAFTMGGAYFCGVETQRGSLEPGKLADLAVLSDGFCRKVRFLGKIQKFGVRNSMTYRLPNSRKSNFATEPPVVIPEPATAVLVGSGLLGLLGLIGWRRQRQNPWAWGTHRQPRPDAGRS